MVLSTDGRTCAGAAIDAAERQGSVACSKLHRKVQADEPWGYPGDQRNKRHDLRETSQCDQKGCKQLAEIMAGHLKFHDKSQGFIYRHLRALDAVHHDLIVELLA